MGSDAGQTVYDGRINGALVSSVYESALMFVVLPPVSPDE
jgi:hypothetical protein